MTLILSTMLSELIYVIRCLKIICLHLYSWTVTGGRQLFWRSVPLGLRDAEICETSRVKPPVLFHFIISLSWTRFHSDSGSRCCSRQPGSSCRCRRQLHPARATSPRSPALEMICDLDSFLLHRPKPQRLLSDVLVFFFLASAANVSPNVLVQQLRIPEREATHQHFGDSRGRWNNEACVWENMPTPHRKGPEWNLEPSCRACRQHRGHEINITHVCFHADMWWNDKAHLNKINTLHIHDTLEKKQKPFNLTSIQKQQSSV